VKRWILVLLLLLSIGLNLGLLLQRGREKKERQERREARLEMRGEPGGDSRSRPLLERLVGRMVERVGVEGEQRERFVAIQENFFSGTVAKRERLRQSHRALRENLSAPQPDRALAETQIAEITAAQKEIEAAFLDNYFATIAILDPDQRERYNRLMSDLRRFRPWERRGRREGGREERRHRREASQDRGGDEGPPQN
jgi:Spy/CpxP family protein refolding chaperone